MGFFPKHIQSQYTIKPVRFIYYYTDCTANSFYCRLHTGKKPCWIISRISRNHLEHNSCCSYFNSRKDLRVQLQDFSLGISQCNSRLRHDAPCTWGHTTGALDIQVLSKAKQDSMYREGSGTRLFLKERIFYKDLKLGFR